MTGFAASGTGDTQEKWNTLFQWFHRHPELGFEEYETTGKIREVLNDLSVQIVPCGLKTGLLALIEGKLPGKEIAVRADIDALAVEEESGVPYVSENNGRMHACGHDFHTTVLLQAASILSAAKDSIRGRIWLIFQPAEEVMDGAKAVMAQKKLGDVSEFYGFHADPDLDEGVIGIEEGFVTSAVDRFEIEIIGKGCHGALPHLGKNPLDVMTGLAGALKGFIHRPIPATDPCVVSITRMHGGSSWNIIPEKAFMEGTVRTFSRQTRAEIEAGFRRILDGYAALTQTDIRLTWTTGCSAVENNAALCEAARKMAAETGTRTIRIQKLMTGDDFGLYGDETPGSISLYLKAGTGKGPALHSPGFKVDPYAIGPTAEYLAHLLMSRL